MQKIKLTTLIISLVLLSASCGSSKKEKESVVTDKKGAFCMVSSINAFNFTESYKSYALNWQNKITLKILFS